jgi:hypothetical protein
VALLACLAGVFATPATASTTCGPGEALESCGGAGSDGSTYTGVIAIPGLHGKGGSHGSASGGGCTDCEWLIVPACPSNGPQPGMDAMCTGAATSCVSRGEEGILMRAFMRHADGAWQMMGTYCTGAAGAVVTVADVAPQAGQAYREQMRPGAATFGFEPDAGQVVNIPTFFTASGAEPMSASFGPDAVRMTITATPAYVWDFGDGATLETQSRGGPAPDGDVTHTYTSAATRHVTLTTRWSAEFTVVTAMGTFGPFAIGGPPVAPSTSREVVVREARADLVSR